MSKKKKSDKWSYKISPYVTRLFETIDIQLSEDNQQREFLNYLKSLPERFLQGKIAVDFGDFKFNFALFLK